MHVDFNILSLLFLYVLDSVALSTDTLTSVKSRVEWGGRGWESLFLRFRSDLCDLHADPRGGCHGESCAVVRGASSSPPFLLTLLSSSSCFLHLHPLPLLFSLPSFCLLFKCFHLFLMKKHSWSIVILFREEVVQNIPFIWWDYWKELWKEHQIRFNYLLWHPVKYICITGFMFNSSH